MANGAGAGGTRFQIIGELVDEISPKLKEIASKNIPELIGAFAALAAIEATKFMAEMVNKAAEVGDELSKLSQITGESTETLSGMRLVLAQVGISTEQFAQAHRELAKKLMEAQDPTSNVTALFKNLGIATKDANGQIRGTGAVLKDIADKFDKMKDGPSKAAAAMELMGETGTKMIPALKGGSKAMDEAYEKAKALGLVWSDEKAKDANTYKDSMTAISMAFQGLGEKITQSLITKLAEIVKYIAESAEEGGILRGVLDGLAWIISGPIAAALDIFSTLLSTVAFGFQLIGKFAGAAAAAITMLVNGDIKGASAVFDQFNEDMDKAWDRYKKFNEDVWNSEKKPQTYTNPGSDNGDNGKWAKKELDMYTNALAGLKKELAQAGQAGKTFETTLETQYGQLRFLTKAHKEELIEYARKIDVAKLHVQLIQQEVALREQAVGKVRTAEVADNAASIANLKERAGYIAANTQLIAFQSQMQVKLAEIENNKDENVKKRLREELELEYKKFTLGGEMYKKAQEMGEMEFVVTQRTKAYNEAIGTSLTTELQLLEARKGYDALLANGQITMERWTQLVKDNTRAQEDNKLALDAAGKAFKGIVDNRRGIEDTKTAMEEMKKAFQEGKISAAEYELEMYNLQSNLDSLNPTFAINQLQKMKDEMRSAAAGFESMFSNGIFDMMQGKWTSLGDLVKQTIDRMVANMIAAKLQFALFGDLGSTPAGKTPNSTGLLGGLFTSFFGGFREGGGDVQAGKAYIVGEKRPEVFVPSTNGTILSNAASVAGGSNVNIQISALDGADAMRVLSNYKREIAQMVSTTNKAYNLR
jgi:hypothetical protein